MECFFTSQDKMDEMEHNSESLIETYVTDENALFRNERIISHTINSLLTSLVRSVQ